MAILALLHMEEEATRMEEEVVTHTEEEAETSLQAEEEGMVDLEEVNEVEAMKFLFATIDGEDLLLPQSPATMRLQLRIYQACLEAVGKPYIKAPPASAKPRRRASIYLFDNNQSRANNFRCACRLQSYLSPKRTRRFTRVSHSNT